jgi:hypothetical protein
MSSILTDLVYEPKCGVRGGGGCGLSANEYSYAYGAQRNFGDQTPYLTYGREEKQSVPRQRRGMLTFKDRKRNRFSFCLHIVAFLFSSSISIPPKLIVGTFFPASHCLLELTVSIFFVPTSCGPVLLSTNMLSPDS